MDLKYVVVQAGGKGSRMERLTRNKPKALVPVNISPVQKVFGQEIYRHRRL